MNAIQFDSTPSLKNPLMIVAFEGWNDGGSAASNAIKRMIDAFGAQKFAQIDPEEFYVFSENRPTVRIAESQRRVIDWQRNHFYYGALPGAERDVVLFLGVEPNLKWRTFCENVASVAKQFDVKEVVTLGAYLADVLYTLPVNVNGTSNDLQMEERFSLKRTSYEGPTGIIGVLSNYCQSVGLTTLSLWGAVPYYISIPNPKAVHALLTKLKTIFAFDMEMDVLEQDMATFDNEINNVVAKDPNVAAYVRELKKREFLN